MDTKGGPKKSGMYVGPGGYCNDRGREPLGQLNAGKKQGGGQSKAQYDGVKRYQPPSKRATPKG